MVLDNVTCMIIEPLSTDEDVESSLLCVRKVDPHDCTCFSLSISFAAPSRCIYHFFPH